ncbi:MAG TPA: hypothetical protein VG095_10125 [Chthoniobacterales bacterium]|nr:hypothetical protein [Chthoniobacterales bacterium]
MSAAPFEVPKATLQPPLVTFSEVANFTPVNGLTINGFTFTENMPTAFTAPSASGPGNTNNITGDTALSGVPPGAGYILSVSLASPALSFGFGFALQTTGSVANAVTLTLFSGMTNLGSLVFAGANDPTFTGGYAGIGNDTFFDRVEIAFNAQFPGFAVDNFSARAAVPEAGGTWLMLLSSAASLALVALLRRRSPKTPAIG